jgi:hypothetical protein
LLCRHDALLNQVGGLEQAVTQRTTRKARDWV